MLQNDSKVSKMDLKSFSSQYVVRCAIWYHLYNFKKVKNTHAGVLILVKLQASAPMGAFHVF